ncbi:hypothetical protein D5086_008267 [Populus alba]|uniref:Uncharacterized protein n=1 Tax=Populus alba TaxID=43335 RepID=A0ACC4CF40_POPAL
MMVAEMSIGFSDSLAETANQCLDEVKDFLRIVSRKDWIIRLTRRAVVFVKSTIERYKKASADSSNTGSVSEANAQYYQQEAAKLRSQIGNLQNSNRHMLGEALSSLSVKELKSLEIRLEKGISRIRSKKNELLFAEIEYMQKREVDLHNNNQLLRAKISENERKRQSMNLMPGGADFEIVQSQPYDSRNYSQVNGIPPASHYSHQDQMALQLVFHYSCNGELMLEEFQVTLLSHVEKSVEVHYGLTSPTLLDIAMNSDIIWLHLVLKSK